MLKCQRNGESSFAISARSRKERRERVVEGIGIEGAVEKDREREARTCTSVPVLSAMLIPAIFN